MTRRILLLVPGLLLAVGMASAAEKTTISRNPQPGDFNVDFLAAKLNGAVVGAGFHYQWKKSGQSLGLMLLHTQANGVSGTTPFRVGCKTYHAPFETGDSSHNGVAVTYSVKVGSR